MSWSASDDATVAGDPALLTDPAGGPREGRLLPGAAVGRYMVLSRLGAGGMGVVYAAYDPDLDRRVALKLLLPDLGGGSADRERERRMLEQEAQALAKLSHPNVIAIHDVGEHQGRVFMAMEFVDGQTLEEWLEDQQPSWSEILDVFLRAGEGLVAAHAEGMVHRDFKPGNVMVSKDGRVRVMDFGLARTVLPGGLDAPGALGTPAYMAPEQFLGSGIDARSDQFSFCVSLWGALAGTRPFGGDELGELVANVQAGRRQDPGPRWAKVPPRVRRAVSRGLEVDPQQRWSSMEPLLAELAHQPDRRRSTVVGVAGLVALGAVLWAGFRPEGSRCESPSSEIAGSWDPDRRAAVEQAVRATAVPHAEDTWLRVEAGLDDYAVALTEIRHGLCTLPPRDELAGERTVCLDRRERALRSMVEVLQEADASVVDEAVDAVAGLPELSRCLDVAHLSAKVEPPRDSEVAAAVEALRERLARAGALLGAGKADDAAVVLEPVGEASRALGYEPLIGEVELMMARVVGDRGRSREAVAQGLAAYERLLEVGHDEAAAVAARLLASELGDRQAKADEGLAWVPTARALTRRAELGSDAEARLGLVVANIHLARGALDDAEAELVRARALRVDTHGSEHVSVYPAELGLGTVYAQRGEIARAFEPMGRALRIAEQGLGPEHPDVAAILLNLGNLYAESDQLERAREHYARSLAITDAVRGSEHPQLVLVLNNLASVEQRQGQLDVAGERFGRALRIAEMAQGSRGSDVALTLINLSNLELERGDPSAAEVLARRAVSIWTRRLGPEPAHPHAAAALNNLGSALAALERLDEARVELEHSLRLWEELVGREHPALVDPLGGLANVWLRLDRPDEARSAIARRLALRDPAGELEQDRALARALRARSRWQRGEEPAGAIADLEAARGVLAQVDAPSVVRAVEQLDRWLAEAREPEPSSPR